MFIITVDRQTHYDYGLQYPLTYQFNIPAGYSDIQVFKKSKTAQDWTLLPEKTRSDFFNGSEAVRFDYEQNHAYISVAFTALSDSILLRIAAGNLPVNAEYCKICQYYDNRQAVVTCSIDDYAAWCKDQAFQSVQAYQRHRLWITLGIISSHCDHNNTWQSIQTLLDSGYTEAGAHSRTHPHVGEYNYESEITGCKNDILTELELPALFSAGNREYVYTWIAPYGEHDAVIDSLLGVEHFLVNRLYYPDYFQIAEWEPEIELFTPMGMTIEMGSPDQFDNATTDTNDLDACFDQAYQQGAIYHLMQHPRSVDWDAPYAEHHLDYISGRKDVWYASVGQLYLYQYLLDADYQTGTGGFTADAPLKKFQLLSNYPNPFNSTTTIPFIINQPGQVTLRIYDLNGRAITTLLKEFRQAGKYQQHWDPGNIASGIYSCHLQMGQVTQTRQLIFLK